MKIALLILIASSALAAEDTYKIFDGKGVIYTIDNSRGSIKPEKLIKTSHEQLFYLNRNQFLALGEKSGSLKRSPDSTYRFIDNENEKVILKRTNNSVYIPEEKKIYFIRNRTMQLQSFDIFSHKTTSWQIWPKDKAIKIAGKSYLPHNYPSALRHLNSNYLLVSLPFKNEKSNKDASFGYFIFNISTGKYFQVTGINISISKLIQSIYFSIEYLTENWGIARNKNTLLELQIKSGKIISAKQLEATDLSIETADYALTYKMNSQSCIGLISKKKQQISNAICSSKNSILKPSISKDRTKVMYVTGSVRDQRIHIFDITKKTTLEIKPIRSWWSDFLYGSRVFYYPQWVN